MFDVHVMNNKNLSVVTTVVYFDQLLGAELTQKLVKTFFSAVFQPFMFISNLFQWFHTWNQQKTSENEQKMYFDYSSKLVDMQKLVHSLRGYPKIVWFQAWNHWRRFEMNKKDWKRWEKKI